MPLMLQDPFIARRVKLKMLKKIKDFTITIFVSLFMGGPLTGENIHDFLIPPLNALQRLLTITLCGSKLKSSLNSNIKLNSSATCEHSLILVQQSNHGPDNSTMGIFGIHLEFYTRIGTKPLTVLYHQHISFPLVPMFTSPNSSKFPDTKAELSLDVKDEDPEISIRSICESHSDALVVNRNAKELIHRT